MKLSVQVIVHLDDDTDPTPMVREVFVLDRDGLAPDTLGLQLPEAKDLLVAVQDSLIERQVSAAIASRRPARTTGSLAGTRTPAPSWYAACSARCACLARAGGAATAATSPPAPSSPWLIAAPGAHWIAPWQRGGGLSLACRGPAGWGVACHTGCY